jgi:hypothetical protein
MEGFPTGWKNLTLEERGLLLTLLLSTKTERWSISDLPRLLGVGIPTAGRFLDACVNAEILASAEGLISLLGPSGDLRKSWERRFEEIFWPAVTTPWKKLGKANALKVWRTNTYALIKPKTEEAAEALCAVIMTGVERYKQLLAQPNAPSMKYPEGWLSAQRWSDEIDETFIEQHGQGPQLKTLSPLDRARRQQDGRSIEMVLTVSEPVARPIPALPERRNELSLPEFDFAL